MRGKPFAPGKSGNPSGRPKIVAELRDLARQHAPAAIKELARLSLKAKSEAVRVGAARELFDRGYGKATQFVEGTLDHTALPSELPVINFIFTDDPPKD